MRFSTRVLLPVLVCLLAPVTLLADQPSAPGGDDLVARAEAMVDEGRIEEAARAFRDASRQHPRDAALAERALVLRRVVSMRRFVETQPDAPQWLTSAVTLHAFYLTEDLPRAALEIAERAHERETDARTTVMVAEALLALGKDQDAAVLLAARKTPTPHERVLNAIAVAHLGHAEAARGLVAGLDLGGEGDAPGLLQDAARVAVLVGSPERAYVLLTRSFEITPPAALDAAKDRVRRCEDFARVRDTEAFRKLLATESKVARTCSGGSSCATCPNRGGCGGR